ncbi:MAG: helix-turn-helix domain-containing protein [Brachybacterium sp.]|uniref:helix-turn-helix domain-containing protein n=1 Tax=Brachybacterium sp. TaxID=1891286 RepID=UPI00324296FE
MEPTYLTVEQAAEHIQVSKKTIRRWMDDGRLIGRYFGPGVIRIRLDDLENLPETTRADTDNTNA